MRGRARKARKSGRLKDRPDARIANLTEYWRVLGQHPTLRDDWRELRERVIGTLVGDLTIPEGSRWERDTPLHLRVPEQVALRTAIPPEQRASPSASSAGTCCTSVPISWVATICGEQGFQGFRSRDSLRQSRRNGRRSPVSWPFSAGASAVQGQGTGTDPGVAPLERATYPLLPPKPLISVRRAAPPRR